jgi:hypothetical protein
MSLSAKSSGTVIAVDFTYEEGDAGAYPPTVRHLEIEQVTSQKSPYVLYLKGYARAPITDIGCAIVHSPIPRSPISSSTSRTWC